MIVAIVRISGKFLRVFRDGRKGLPEDVFCSPPAAPPALSLCNYLGSAREIERLDLARAITSRQISAHSIQTKICRRLLMRNLSCGRSNAILFFLATKCLEKGLW